MNKPVVKFKMQSRTKHQHLLELTREEDGTFTLIKHAANQRDETESIRDLTAEIIQEMANTTEFIKNHKI